MDRPLDTDSVQTGLQGMHPLLEVRSDVLRRRGGHRGRVDTVDGLDLIFIGVPPSERFEAASSALRGGANVFLEWPPTTSIRECARLVRLAEEAGLEVAVSRPLRMGVRDVSWRPRLISMEIEGADSITHALADAVDLACALARSGSVQRVEAEAVYDDDRVPVAAGLSVRFHNGAFAQALIRPGGASQGVRLFASTSGREIERIVNVDAVALAEETRGMLRAVEEGQPPPLSALDALQTLRIVERVQGVLR